MATIFVLIFAIDAFDTPLFSRRYAIDFFFRLLSPFLFAAAIFTLRPLR